MKPQLLLVLLLLPLLGWSQDNIIMKDGSEIGAKVLEISPDYVKYRKQDNLQGPDYFVNRYEVFMVQFENGTSEVISPIDLSQPVPGNNDYYRRNGPLVGGEYRSPGLAFLFSALLPGGGQYYNRDHAKGGVMTGLYVASILTIASSPYYDCYYGEYYDSQGNVYYDYYDCNNQGSIQRGIGSGVMMGTWLWSIIDAPVRAAAINRNNRSNAAGLLEFEKKDKWALQIEPLGRAGMGGSLNLQF